MQGSSPVLLGIPGIETLGVLTISYEKIGRQLKPDNNPDKRQRNCQSERAVQIEGRKPESCTSNKQDVDTQKAVQEKGRKPESCTNKRQDAAVQKQCNAVNTPKLAVTPNPVVTGKNYSDNSLLSEPRNNDDKSFFSELIINDIQSFLSEKFREDDMEINVEQTNQKTIIVVKALFQTSLKMLAQMQKGNQRRRKENKRKEKNNSKIDISDNDTHRSEYETISMPRELENSDQKHNGDKYGEFRGKSEDIEDKNIMTQKIILIASNTGPCIM